MANGKALLASATVLMVGLVLAGTNPGDKATEARALRTREAARRIEAGGGPAKRAEEAPAVAAIGWGENAVPTVKPGEAAADAQTQVKKLMKQSAGELRVAAMPLTEAAAASGVAFEPAPVADRGSRDAGDDCATALSMNMSCSNSTTNITFRSPWVQDAAPDPAIVGNCNWDNAYGYYVGNSIWLKFVPGALQTAAVIDVCDSTAEIPATWMAVYSSTGVCTGLTQIACNLRAGCHVGVCCGLDKGWIGCDSYYDPPTGGDCSGGASKVVVANLVQGATYYVRVSILGWSDGTNDLCVGTYTVHFYVDCGQPMACDPNAAGAFAENELSPETAASRVNDGCDGTGDIPAFGTMRCNQVVCGTSWADGTNRDTDWYRIMEPNVATLSWTVKAQFPASVKILKAGPDPNDPCTGFTVVAQNDPNTSVPYIPTTITYAAAPPGTYYLYVAPRAGELVASWEIYQGTFTETPCNVATGACCDASVDPNNPTCSLTVATACTGAGKHYWGDGTVCPPGNGCLVCPTGAYVSPEVVCSDGYVDTYDSGCAFSTTDPALPNQLICGQTYCGTSGAFVTGGANARDNDWYFVDLTDTGDPNNPNIKWTDPTGTSCEGRQITIHAYAEFDAEILIWDLLAPQTPCESVDTSVDVFAKAGDEINFSFCKKKVADSSHPYGDFFVIIRPAYRGTSREFPCGSHYWIQMQCAADCDVGACCTSTGCVAARTYLECCNLSGTWFGAGTECGPFGGHFCTCDTVAAIVPENEPNCGQPADTVDGGCNTTPNKFITLPNCGAGVCGTISTGWQPDPNDPNSPTFRDLDWYLYHHTTGDLALYVGAQFDGVVYISGPLVDPCTPCPKPDGYSGDFTAASSNFIILPAALAGTNTWWEIIVTSAWDPAVPCTAGQDRYELTANSGLEGACCVDPNTCIQTYACICTDFGGTFWGEGQACTRTPCGYPNGVCCTPPGVCLVVVQASCLSPNVWHGEWASCGPPNPCPQLGACCTPAGSCTLTPQANCLSPNVWLGAGTVCLICPPPGACCTPTGGCSVTLQSTCTTPNTWHGEWMSCAPNPCTPTSACCSPTGTCLVMTQAACTAAGGHYYGDNTTCRTGNKCPLWCNGDMNCNGRVTFVDIDLFVAALSGESAWMHWPCPWLNADCNGDGIVTFADIDCFVGRIGTTCP